MSDKALFLNLPAELRLKVYHFLFQPSTLIFVVDHDLHSDCQSSPARTFDDSDANRWWIYSQKAVPRQKYLTDLDGAVFVDSRGLPDLSLLRVNRLIWLEATNVAYSSVAFNFETALPALVPFLARIGPHARAAIRELHLEHVPPEKVRCWDERRLWGESCAYIAQWLQLQSLHVEYRYLSGRNWSSEDWRSKLELNDQGVPLDHELNASLCTNESSSAAYVLSINSTGVPRCRDFLETLPIESPAQMRQILNTDPITNHPFHPGFRELVKITGLEKLELRLKGGLTQQIKLEVDEFLRARMVKQ